MADSYQGSGQPRLRSGWLDGWTKAPAYRGAQCSGNGSGGHGHDGHPRPRAATLVSAGTPAYNYAPTVCPVEVQTLSPGVTAVQAVATSAEAETLAKQGQVAIVFPRS
jgi:hypothetical protein